MRGAEPTASENGHGSSTAERSPANTPEALIDLARAVPDADVIVVSQGVGADWLREQADHERVTNLTVLPFQPFESIPDVLATGDVLIALLTADAASHSVPSKVLSYLCAGRPIVASIPADNAAARMITERADAGVAVDPGDSVALVLAAKRLLAEPDRRKEMGAAARRFAETTFSADRVARQLIDIVNR